MCNSVTATSIGVAKGAMVCARRKKFRGGGKFTGESCKCTPYSEHAPSRQSKSPIL